MEFEQYKDPVVLKEQHAYTDKEDVRITFTETQILSMKERYYQLNKSLFEKLEAVKHIQALFKNNTEDSELNLELHTIAEKEFSDVGTKSLQAECNSLLKKINKGFETINMTVYGLDYPEAGLMAVYSDQGDFIYSRPLTRQEKQTNIHSINRLTGTNDQ